MRKAGITLVSLVITIIVLLILAGVAISLAITAEGLIEKAEEAAREWNEKVKEEEEVLAKLEGEAEGVNPPKLGEGMIPVYYENGWKKADSSNKDKNWYECDTQNKKWANAVTVKEGKREE